MEAVESAIEAAVAETTEAVGSGVSSRRRFLRIGGAVAAGTAAGAFVRPGGANAADGDFIEIGAINGGTSTTMLLADLPGGEAAMQIANPNVNGVGLLVGGTSTALSAYTDNVDGTAVLIDGALLFESFISMPANTGTWSSGHIVSSDVDNSLWICTEGGTPGRWQKLGGGTATAGSFHPIEPTRVFDSRLPIPSPGRLGAGDSRVVSVKDGRSLTTGGVTVADMVPAGATAVTFNLVAVGTAGGGFLAIAPGNATTYKASSINWSGPTTVANGGTAKLDGNRQLKVFCDGAGSADFLIDITGYYR